MQVTDVPLQEPDHEVRADFFATKRKAGVVELGSIVDAETVDRRD